jgi:CheY-like chemotaxis protein
MEKTKILLVEDQAIIALVESKIIEKNGFDVRTAYSGEQALDILEEDCEFSLILMDIDLGEGIDGTETAQRILAKHDLPVAFLSAHTEPEVVLKTEGITSYGYIVKNSGETVLITSIKMALRLFEAKMKEKESLRALQHSHDLMSYIIEHTRSDIAVHDRDLNYIYVSQSYLDQFNVKKRDVLGKHHYEVFPDLPEKWR